MPITPKAFYMIRHGETVANQEDWFSGSIDTPLTGLGRQQADIARQIVEQLDDQPNMIIHSHLSRARDTAAIINQNLGLPLQEDPDYAEMFVGD